MIILEFDPGGKKHRNGAAIWRAGSKPVSKSFDCVDTTLDWFERELGEDHPTAAGIDTLLCWQTGPGGLREPDRRLQAKYRAVRSSIVAPNSLYGSMAIQGMAMAIRLRKNWPDIKLNETHPKVISPKPTASTIFATIWSAGSARGKNVSSTGHRQTNTNGTR